MTSAATGNTSGVVLVKHPSVVTPTKNASKLQYIDVEIFPVGLHWSMNIFMLVTTLLGIFGNGLVCYFFAKKKIKRTSFNLLLLNLSAADLMADTFAYLHIFIDLKMLRNVSQSAADILCAFTIGITPFGIMTSVSVLTLTYISINRFVFIVYPMKTSWFKSQMKTVCFLVVVWISSTAYVIPNVFAFRYDPEYALCYREWPKIINVPLWSVSGIILGLIVPITIMLLTLFATKRQFKRIRGGTSSNTEAMKRKKRTVRLLGFLIIAFFSCMAPSSIYLLFFISITSVWPPGNEGQYTRMRWIRATFLICLLNTVADPVIYGYHNNEFQTCFKEIFSRMQRLKTRQRTYVVSNENTSSSTETARAAANAKVSNTASTDVSKNDSTQVNNAAADKVNKIDGAEINKTDAAAINKAFEELE